MLSNYDILIGKLEEFIRKYYKNQLIRGAIYGATAFLAFFLLIALLEYYGHFNSTIRTLLFYSFLLVNGFILITQVLAPLLKLKKLGKTLSHDQAAEIIGKHFENVRDKLLNVLQLKKVETQSSHHSVNQSTISLIEAGIDQKIKELKPVPFSSAINMGENKKYIKYFLIPFIIIVVIVFIAPGIITESTERLIEHSQYFEKQAPFHFTILNKDLKAMQQDDLQLDVKIDGSPVPENAFIEMEGVQYKLQKETPISFHYLFKNIQKSISFRLFGDGYYSQPYELVALPNPIILNFDISLEYPAYIKKAKDNIRNTGDLVIPEGTKVVWNFNTKNTDIVKLRFQDTSVIVDRKAKNAFSYSKRFLKNDGYAICTSNEYLKNRDSILYSISVIPDQYPEIQLEQQSDSISTKQIYFKGIIKDDYGFTKMDFAYHFLKSPNDTTSSPNEIFTEILPINQNLTEQSFFFFWDLNKVNVLAGDNIEYYFEVWDNDGVTGSKSTKSQTKIFKAPSLKEITENTTHKNDAIKEELKQSISAAKALQNELNEFNKKIVEKKELTWEDKKKAEDLLKRQQDLQNKAEEVQKENEKNIRQQQEYKQPNEELIQKQQELKKLMDQLMTDDMKKLLEEMQKLVQNADKQKMQEMLDKMKLSSKDMEKELDRTLEIFKQMEFEQKLKETIDNLNQLATKEEDFSKESLDNKGGNKELESKQNEAGKDFEDIKKEMNDLDKKNQTLEKPEKFENNQQEQKSIEQDMKDSKQSLSENKNKKASDSQKNASSKMKKMADKLQQMKQGNEAEENEEDMNVIRVLLENLLRLSFSQEYLMEELKNINTNDPRFLKLSQQQATLKEDSKMIDDSLYALSKRNIQIETKVNHEMATINQNMEYAIANLEERNIYMARSRQETIMTSVNNLALMLSESLEKIQKESMNAKPGSKSCKKPGKGKPQTVSDMRKMQENLNKKLEDMKKGMKPGQKPSDKSGQGEFGQSMSEQLARIAAEQEALRLQLQKMQKDINQNDKGAKSLGDLDKIENEMDQTEQDIVNKMITEQTLHRQQDILTRLLEAEKAEQERDWDEKRESKEGKDDIKRNPNEFDAYKRMKQKETELLKTIPPSLNPYYKKKVDDYFQNIE